MEKAIRIMNKMGKASLLNSTGNCESAMLQNKKSGKKTKRAAEAIHTVFTVNSGAMAPAVTRPMRSNKLNSRKKNGTYKSL